MVSRFKAAKHDNNSPEEPSSSSSGGSSSSSSSGTDRQIYTGARVLLEGRKHGALRPQKPLRLIRDEEVGGVGNFYI